MSKLDTKVVSMIKRTVERLSSAFDGSTRRESQIKMVNDIRHVLMSEHSKIVVCEAGTGVGKTLAYLIGAVSTAKATGKCVVISTATVSLQEQIIKKDLPLFKAVFPMEISVALAKGKARFVCREKLKHMIDYAQGTLALNPDDAGFLPTLSEEDALTLVKMNQALSTGSWNGDRDSWEGQAVSNNVWDNLASDQHQCKANFPLHAKCPYHNAHKAVFSADIIVANHALVVNDLEMGGGVLIPSTDDAIYVFDEAHQLPEIVRDSKEEAINIKRCIELLERFDRSHKQRNLTRLLTADTANKVVPKLDILLSNFKSDLGALVEWSIQSRIKLLNENSVCRFEFGALPESLSNLVNHLKVSCCGICRLLEKIQDALSDLVKEDKPFAEASFAEVSFYYSRFNSILRCLTLLETVHETGIQPAKWMKLDSQDCCLLCANEVDIKRYLYDRLWTSNSGVVLTSATLRSLGTFHDFAEEVGLNYEYSAYFRHYSSPFNYQNSDLIIPNDIPFEPNTEQYKVWLKTNLLRFVSDQNATLVLFTSKALMEEIRTQIELHCTNSGILLQCQGDAPTKIIIDNHKKALAQSMRSIIFGLNSFSEGIDLRGNLLENLIITRIPFEMPDSPVLAHRAEYEKSLGNLPFFTITLPLACRALTQSVGRLIRTEEDVGRCIILDKRIITKRYGEQLLVSLPPLRRVSL